MTTVQIDVEVITTDTGSKLVTARRGDNFVQAFLFPGEVETVNDLAAWLLAQQGRQQAKDTALQKRLTITYHIDQVTDPDTGQPVDQTVIDSVTTEPLPQDDGKAKFGALSGWATWTGQEASDWIMTNVTDLASAKTALAAMAKAIIHLRKISVGE